MTNNKQLDFFEIWEPESKPMNPLIEMYVGVDELFTANFTANFTQVTSTLTTIMGDAEINGLIQVCPDNGD